ncbi:MAG TPA: hypothetical protein VH063_15680 [Gaiellaceae bacterium]|jgi:hypothetical protein|nr:hypothetical protein [Gaiellaceae bacterium]
MRKLLCLFAGLLALGVGGSAAGGGGPFALVGGSASGGIPLAGSGPRGITVRFVDHGTFYVGVTVRNTSTKTLTIVSARTPERAGSIVRLASARLIPTTPCNSHGGDLLCLPWDPRAPPSSHSLAVKPGASAAIKLNYRLGTCAEAKTASFATGRELQLSFETPGGSIQEQSFPLAGAKLELQKPAGVECLTRPFSHIGLVGSFTTSPGHLPIPGSDGDTCTREPGGGLSFQSRYFQDRSEIEFRIAIDLPRFHGAGSYVRRGVVTVYGGFGAGPFTVFHDPKAPVTVTEAARSTVTGTFSAVLSGHRTFFRAYGTWRCAILPS